MQTFFREFGRHIKVESGEPHAGPPLPAAENLIGSAAGERSSSAASLDDFDSIYSQ